MFLRAPVTKNGGIQKYIVRLWLLCMFTKSQGLKRRKYREKIFSSAVSKISSIPPNVHQMSSCRESSFVIVHFDRERSVSSRQSSALSPQPTSRRVPSSFFSRSSSSSADFSEIFIDLQPVDPTTLYTARSVAGNETHSWIHTNPEVEAAATDPASDECVSHSGGGSLLSPRGDEEEVDEDGTAGGLLSSNSTLRCGSVASKEIEESAVGFVSHKLNCSLRTLLVFTTAARCKKVEKMLLDDSADCTDTRPVKLRHVPK